jgi:hypothetical protein
MLGLKRASKTSVILRLASRAAFGPIRKVPGPHQSEELEAIVAGRVALASQLPIIAQSDTPRSTRMLLLALAFTAATAFILLFSAAQRHGMIYEGFAEWLDRGQLLSRFWPLSLLLLIAVAFSAAYARNGSIPARSLTRMSTMIALIAASFALSLLVVWALRAFPNSGDEYDYIYQAQTYLAGRLWNPLPAGHEFFSHSHIFEKEQKWIAQYPPGWPLLLAAGHLLALPYWLVSPLCGAALLAALWRLGRRPEPLTAILVVAIVGLSPFFLYNAASYFNHVPAALFGVLFCYFGLEYLDTPRASAAVGAGAALGALGLIRPFDVPIFALPFAIEFLLKARTRHYFFAPMLFLGGAPFLAGLLWYNWRVTGNPLLMVNSWGYPLLHLGLHAVDEWGVPSPLRSRSAMIIVRAVELAEWSSTILVVAYVPALLWKWQRGRLRFHDFVFPIIVIAYFFYPGAVNRYGPRYYFEAYPLLALTVATCAAAFLQRPWRDRWGEAAQALIFAHLVTCILSVAIFSYYMRWIIDQRSDVFDQVARAGLHDAVVILHSPTGVIRPMEQLDLTWNGTDLSGDVLYALNLEGRRDELRQLYANRHFYIYERAEDAPRGTIKPLN